jgi:hypothetical protein
MIRFFRTAAGLAWGAAVLAGSAGAQERVPPALVEQIVREEVAASGYDRGADSLARHTRLERVDLDGDGRAELLVHATGPACAVTGNCPRWVFRERGGAWERILTTSALELFPLESRANGWQELGEVYRPSGQERSRIVHAFDGRRYVQRHVERIRLDLGGDRGGARAAFTVSSTPPGEGVRRVWLDEIPSGAPMVRLSARYDGCPASRAVPGRLCGTPVLVLVAADPAVPWPAFGPAPCFTLGMRSGWSRTSWQMYPGAPVCAARGAVRGLERRRTLELAPSAAQWDSLFTAGPTTLFAGATVLPLSDEAMDALREFLWMVYDANGVPDPWSREK